MLVWTLLLYSLLPLYKSSNSFLSFCVYFVVYSVVFVCDIKYGVAL